MLTAVDNSAEKKLVVWDALSGEKQGEATVSKEFVLLVTLISLTLLFYYVNKRGPMQ